MRMPKVHARVVAIAISLGLVCGCAIVPDERTPLVARDHHVKLKSSAPGMAGAETSIYVREIPAAASSIIPKLDRVVLFIHGGAYGGSTAFDLPRPDYSWMRYLASAGYDTFALDFTGFGLSTRPPPMSDPCNLSEAQQKEFVPILIPAPCPPSHRGPITTMESEWEEMDAVIEYIRKLRGVDKVAIVGWSRAGPRTSGYLLRHPAKVSRVFIFAPAYNRDWSADKPAPGRTFEVARRGKTEPFPKGCEGHEIDPAVRDLVWREGVAADPGGAAWGEVRRQLGPQLYGINQQLAKGVRVPFAAAAGALDNLVTPERVKQFYEDLGSTEKVLIEVACSSHIGLWEKNRTLLFRTSLEWIRDGKIQGTNRGQVRVGF